ncbi:SEC-C metal-binding domain-containing protein [Pseudalkalibacillus decolorationis]|uniref:SEC-C metal-binding domain-containing protein n=1 Tax=Pseudalkalibacillus decolorationis TaxID=163879 RepID=UPI0027E3AE3E|nr:SEC-C metal-binding domain-containing protein [Pseudalkalibacillus decolorationis]
MLAPEKVKPFLLHEEGLIRRWAVEYFSEGFIDGFDKREIMPLVLEGCEMYPEQEMDNRLVLSHAKSLPQTTETIQTILAKMKTKKEINFWYKGIIENADPTLLATFLEEIQLRLSKESYETILKRIEFTKQDTDLLWDELLRFGDEARGKYINDFNYKYGKYLAWELARRNDLSSDQILDQFESYNPDTYRGYSNIYLAFIFGERRIEEAIPALIEWLAYEFEAEIAAEALPKIGSKKTIGLIKEQFIKRNDFGFNMFASSVLANLKCEEAEQAIIELLDDEELDDITAITALADGLCKLISTKGIPNVKQYIDDEYYDPGYLPLKQSLYATCVISGYELSELPQWKQDFQEKSQSRNGTDHPMFDHADPMFSETAFQPQSPIVNENKVGRNEPCPCGSGKKYKKCCGK